MFHRFPFGQGQALESPDPVDSPRDNGDVQVLRRSEMNFLWAEVVEKVYTDVCLYYRLRFCGRVSKHRRKTCMAGRILESRPGCSFSQPDQRSPTQAALGEDIQFLGGRGWLKWLAGKDSLGHRRFADLGRKRILTHFSFSRSLALSVHRRAWRVSQARRSCGEESWRRLRWGTSPRALNSEPSERPKVLCSFADKCGWRACFCVQQSWRLGFWHRRPSVSVKKCPNQNAISSQVEADGRLLQHPDDTGENLACFIWLWVKTPLVP